MFKENTFYKLNEDLTLHHYNDIETKICQKNEIVLITSFTKRNYWYDLYVVYDFKKYKMIVQNVFFTLEDLFTEIA